MAAKRKTEDDRAMRAPAGVAPRVTSSRRASRRSSGTSRTTVPVAPRRKPGRRRASAAAERSVCVKSVDYGAGKSRALSRRRADCFDPGGDLDLVAPHGHEQRTRYRCPRVRNLRDTVPASGVQPAISSRASGSRVKRRLSALRLVDVRTVGPMGAISSREGRDERAPSHRISSREDDRGPAELGRGCSARGGNAGAVQPALSRCIAKACGDAARRSRRPDEHASNSTCRIDRRMAAENCLWGAPGSTGIT